MLEHRLGRDYAFDFIERIRALDAAEPILEETRRAGGGMGFSTFAVGALPRPGTSDLAAFFVSGWPSFWIDLYVGENLAAADPTVDHAYRHIHPATISELRVRHHGEKDKMRMLDITGSSGWTEGIAVPIHSARGYRGLVTFAGQETEMPRRHRVALHMMAIYLHERLRQIMAPDLARNRAASGRLSPGEIECVKWLLAGKSDWEIGEILGIAEATAHWRIEQAKKKFGVKTRAQLTALAVYHRLVQP